MIELLKMILVLGAGMGIGWLKKIGKKDEEILILKDQIESLHAAMKCKDILLKEQSKPEWSEEEKKWLDYCCAAIEMSNYANDNDRNRMVSFLQSLRHQKRWKPDERQLNALKSAISELDYCDDSLPWLYDDLKKLID